MLAGKLQGQKINTSVPLDQLQGFVVASISELDPTGWMRVVLQRDPYQAAPAPAAVATSVPPAPAVPVARANTSAIARS